MPNEEAGACMGKKAGNNKKTTKTRKKTPASPPIAKRHAESLPEVDTAMTDQRQAMAEVSVPESRLETAENRVANHQGTPDSAASVSRIQDAQPDVRKEAEPNDEQGGEQYQPCPDPQAIGTINEMRMAIGHQKDGQEAATGPKYRWHIVVRGLLKRAWVRLCAPCYGWVRTGCKKATLGGALMVLFTGVVAWATCRYSNLASSQLNIMSRQLEQMKTASRAWVGLTNEEPPVKVSPLRIDEGGTAFIDECIITVKNFGNFPAQDVFVTAKLVITQKYASVVEECERMPATYAHHLKGTTVFPGQSPYTWRCTSLVNPSDRIRAKGGDDQFLAYIVGCILYRDQFGEPHDTTFVYCYAKRGTEPEVFFRLDPNTVIETDGCVPRTGNAN